MNRTDPALRSPDWAPFSSQSLHSAASINEPFLASQKRTLAHIHSHVEARLLPSVILSYLLWQMLNDTSEISPNAVRPR